MGVVVRRRRGRGFVRVMCTWQYRSGLAVGSGVVEMLGTVVLGSMSWREMCIARCMYV